MPQLAGYGINPHHQKQLHIPLMNLYFNTDKKKYPKYGVPACYWTKYQAKKRLDSVTDINNRFHGYKIKIFKRNRFYKPYQLMVINSPSLSADYEYKVKILSMIPEVYAKLQTAKQQKQEETKESEDAHENLN